MSTFLPVMTCRSPSSHFTAAICTPPASLAAMHRSHLDLGRRVYIRGHITTPPPPLNLANNKQASKQQASNHLSLPFWLLLPTLWALLYSTHPRPQAVSLPNPSFGQKLIGGAPGRWRQIGRCPPKTAHFVPQNSLFWRKTALEPIQDGQTKGNGSYTPCAPSFPGDKEPFVALELRDMSEKRRKKWPKTARIVCILSHTRPKTRTGRILGYIAKIQIPRAPSPPATPHVLWFSSLKIAQRDA